MKLDPFTELDLYKNDASFKIETIGMVCGRN